MVFKSMRDSVSATVSTWASSISAVYVIQDHPAYIPRGNRRGGLLRLLLSRARLSARPGLRGLWGRMAVWISDCATGFIS